jgi:uncharacterized protein with von Willebrand factor type A (vWA) domain
MAIRYGFRHLDDDDHDDVDVEELLRLLSEDFLENGDLDAAMERLLRDGYTTRDGKRIEGIESLLEQAREKRRALERGLDPEGELLRYHQRLDDIEDKEAAAAQELLEEAIASQDERRVDVTRSLVDERALQRDLIGNDLNERIAGYQQYEFISSEAREAFEGLVEQLRQDLLTTYFEKTKELAQNPSGEEFQELRAMMDALSTMIEQDRRGEALDPSFDDFMGRFGDYFPGATTLEDVVRMMAERAAAADAMFNSLPAEQQRELRNLFSQMLSDLSLDFSLARLSANLRQALPDVDWQRAERLRGQGGGAFSEARGTLEQLGQLRDLEHFLERQPAATGIAEVDIDAIRQNLGDDAARHVEKIRAAMKQLGDRGMVDHSAQGVSLTAKGIRRIGQQALKDLFGQLNDSSTLGSHRSPSVARGGDREETAKPWQPGEAVTLHLAQTLRNAVFRQGPGTPVQLQPDDFMVEEFEATNRAATIFAIDLSLSMAMRHNLVPAKKMVLALTQLIRSKYPKDFVAVVGFGAVAMELKIEDIPGLTIDFNSGTNLQHALALSRHLLRNEKGDRQIVVVTDGEPTAHLNEYGEPFFAWPPEPETLQKTMAEVLRCTKSGITINTFALDIERSQFPFVEQIARINGGRTFYTSIDDLGVYVLDDFVNHRRAV